MQTNQTPQQAPGQPVLAAPGAAPQLQPTGLAGLPAVTLADQVDAPPLWHVDQPAGPAPSGLWQ